MASVHKTVLVEFREHLRVVSFESGGLTSDGENLKDSINGAFGMFSLPHLLPSSFNFTAMIGNDISTYVLDSQYRIKE